MSAFLRGVATALYDSTRCFCVMGAVWLQTWILIIQNIKPPYSKIVVLFQQHKPEILKLKEFFRPFFFKKRQIPLTILLVFVSENKSGKLVNPEQYYNHQVLTILFSIKKITLLEAGNYNMWFCWWIHKLFISCVACA